MTQKKTMTKNEAREFLLGRYIKATGSFELSKVVDHLHKFGCTGMNDSQIEAVGSAARGQKITTHVGDFHNEELRIFCTYGPLTTFMYEAMEELSLSDLLAIEIVEKPDHRALLEEAVKLLEECCPIMHRLTPDVKARSQINKIEQFLKANRP